MPNYFFVGQVLVEMVGQALPYNSGFSGLVTLGNSGWRIGRGIFWRRGSALPAADFQNGG